MRTSSRIESLSYGTIYILGCIVAAFLALGQHPALEELVVQVACSWGYVIYYVLNL
jgi:hypothetical protein